MQDCRMHQNRGSSGCGSWPPWTCIAPHSAQRCSVGHGLAGVEQPVGVERALHGVETRRAPAWPNCTHIWLIFSTPTPCSPVMVPPTSTQSSRISPPKASARSQFAGLVGVVTGSAGAGCRRRRGTRWRTAQAVFARHLADARSTCGQAPARDGAVHAVVVGRDAADRGEGGLAPGPECAGARPRSRQCGSRSRRCASSTARTLRDVLRHFLVRAVDFAQQHRLGVERVAGVHEGLGGARSRGLSIISRPGRDDAGGDDVGRPPRRPLRRRRTPPAPPARVRGFGSSLTVTSVITREHAFASRSAARAGRSRARRALRRRARRVRRRW